MERFGYGGVVYLALNFLIVGAEARWHVLYRLTMLDASAIRTLLPAIAKIIHHSIS
jgi:hypothetical protein